MSDNQGGIWQMVSNVGGGVAFVGALSFVLHFVGMEFRGLDLIDQWGRETGIAIRIGMIVIGGAIWFLAKKKVPQDPS